MTINVTLLREALEYVTAHPEEWDQSVWWRRAKTKCGTAGCIAGTVAVKLLGKVPHWHVWSDNAMDLVGTEQSINEFAAEALGLDSTQEDALFEGDNTLHDLWALAEVFTDGEITVPPEVATLPLLNFNDHVMEYQF